MYHKSHRKELMRLYKKWPDIKRYLRSKGCLPTDAEDIFQEALIIYSRKRQEKDFQLEVERFIPPSKVLAFWKEKFNNTILATREFEKCMRGIHPSLMELDAMLKVASATYKWA